MTNLISYGAIGLGLALAILTFKLLNNEQKKQNPNSNIIISSYGFMILSIIISLSGFISESINKKYEHSKIIKENDKLTTQNLILLSTIEKLKSTNQQFEKIKHTLDTLLDIKGSILNKSQTISQIKNELVVIQETMKKELKFFEK
jgi:predicted PurR-regulated permease PerM